MGQLRLLPSKTNPRVKRWQAPQNPLQQPIPPKLGKASPAPIDASELTVVKRGRGDGGALAELSVGHISLAKKPDGSLWVVKGQRPNGNPGNGAVDDFDKEILNSVIAQRMGVDAAEYTRLNGDGSHLFRGKRMGAAPKIASPYLDGRSLAALVFGNKSPEVWRMFGGALSASFPVLLQLDDDQVQQRLAVQTGYGYEAKVPPAVLQDQAAKGLALSLATLDPDRHWGNTLVVPNRGLVQIDFGHSANVAIDHPKTPFFYDIQKLFPNHKQIYNSLSQALRGSPFSDGFEEAIDRYHSLDMDDVMDEAEVPKKRRTGKKMRFR